MSVLKLLLAEGLDVNVPLGGTRECEIQLCLENLDCCSWAVRSDLAPNPSFCYLNINQSAQQLSLLSWLALGLAPAAWHSGDDCSSASRQPSTPLPGACEVAPCGVPQPLGRDSCPQRRPKNLLLRGEVLSRPEMAGAVLLKALGVNTALLFFLCEGPLCWHEFLFSWRAESPFD